MLCWWIRLKTYTTYENGNTVLSIIANDIKSIYSNCREWSVLEFTMVMPSLWELDSATSRRRDAMYDHPDRSGRYTGKDY